MAPKLDAVSWTSERMISRVEDDVPEGDDDGVSCASADDEGEYGYLQIDDYRSCKRSGAELVKRWVRLPKGTPVETYARHPSSHASHQHPKLLSSCSDLGRENTSSTAASSSDTRRVRFRDGDVPGCEGEPAVWRPVADWIFIDRDICGISLYEYDPESAIRDFASSPYGCDFLHALEITVAENAFDEAAAARCTESEATYRREEKQLDKALFSAGVHVHTWLHLHEPTSGLEEPRKFEVSI